MCFLKVSNDAMVVCYHISRLSELLQLLLNLSYFLLQLSNHAHKTLKSGNHFRESG